MCGVEPGANELFGCIQRLSWPLSGAQFFEALPEHSRLALHMSGSIGALGCMAVWTSCGCLTNTSGHWVSLIGWPAACDRGINAFLSILTSYLFPCPLNLVTCQFLPTS